MRSLDHLQQPVRPAAWRRHTGLIVLGSMGGLSVLLLVLSVFGDQGIFRIRSLSRDKVSLTAKVADAERTSAQLREQLNDLHQGKVSYELAAREKLGLVKPGEIVYDFRSDPLRATERAAAER